MNKKISVLMSVYNSENTLEDSIKSILNQTFTDFEFLISDDGSTDGSVEILKSYKKIDSRINIYFNKENIGLTKSLNKLLKHSSSEYIARQDSDDKSFDKRLENQMNVINNLNLDFCTSRALKDGKNITPNLKHFLPYKIVMNYLNPFVHGTLLIKEKIIKELGGYDERFYYAQDYKLFKDLLNKNYKYKVISTPLYYLNSKNNISSNKKKEQYYYADCVRKNKIPKTKII